MKEKNLFGLVVCGGESSRMGMDKSLIVYFTKPQRYYLYDLMKPLCQQVFISCNKNQSITIIPEYKKIVDGKEYEQIGPMASLLSAFTQFPEKDLLVIACDYPFISLENLEELINVKEESDLAVSYFNSETDMKEPLLAIYSSECYPLLLQQFDKKDYSLRNFLKEINAKKIIPSSLLSLKSVDTPEDFHETLLKLREMNKLVHAL